MTEAAYEAGKQPLFWSVRDKILPCRLILACFCPVATDSSYTPHCQSPVSEALRGLHKAAHLFFLFLSNL